MRHSRITCLPPLKSTHCGCAEGVKPASCCTPRMRSSGADLWVGARKAGRRAKSKCWSASYKETPR